MDPNKRIKKELDRYRMEYDLYEKLPCTNEECQEFDDLLKCGKRLPEDVYQDSDWRNTNGSKFYRIARSDVSQADIMEYFTYQKLDVLETIRNCAVFFTVLTIIAIIFFLLVAIF